MADVTANDCVFCDLTQFRAADVCIENAFCFYASTGDPRNPPDVLLDAASSFLSRIACRPSTSLRRSGQRRTSFSCKAKAAQDERLAHLHVIPRFDDEPLADRGGRSAIKVPENRRPDPLRPGNGRAWSFGPTARSRA